MTSAQQRMTLNDPMDLLVRPVAAGEQTEPDDDQADDKEGSAHDAGRRVHRD